MKRNNSSQIRRLLISLIPIQAMIVGLPAINSLLNGFIVGYFFKATALAAVGFAGPLTSLVPVLSGTLASGAQLVCGRLLGRGDRDGLRSTFNTACITSGLIGVLLTVLMLCLSRPLAVILGAAGDELIAQTSAYLLGLAPSMIFSNLFTCLLPFLQLERAEKTSTAAITVLLVVNTGFNLLNVFVLKLGMFGVGFATSVANLAAVAVCIPYFLHRSSAFPVCPADFSLKTLKDVICRGFPSALTPLAAMIRTRILNQLVFSLGGTVAVAALTVAAKLTDSIGCTVEGGYVGAGDLVSSVLVGERDVDSLRRLPREMMSVIWPVDVAAYALVFILAKPIALLFGAAPADLDLYAMIIRLFNFWYVTNIVKAPPVLIYRALGHNILVSVLYVTGCLIYPLLCFGFSALFLGDKGLPLIISTPWIGEVMLIITYVIIYYVRRKKLPDSIFHLVDIPSDFAAPADDRFSATITKLSQVSDASQGIIDFCLKKGIDARRSRMCGLCVEEMAADSLRHGVPENGKNFSIALRVLHEDGGITILMRDNGMHFDPNEWLRLYAQDDPSRSIGLKLVSQQAREMNYTAALGLNVLTIKL